MSYYKIETLYVKEDEVFTVKEGDVITNTEVSDMGIGIHYITILRKVRGGTPTPTHR